MSRRKMSAFRHIWMCGLDCTQTRIDSLSFHADLTLAGYTSKEDAYEASMVYGDLILVTAKD